MFDPLVDSEAPSGQSHPSAYWHAISDTPTPKPRLEQDWETDTLIIGAGLTGMSCAWHCEQYGKETTVIDANQPGWGCSGRNAGFVLPGSGRLDFAGLKASFSEDIASNTNKHYYQALNTLEKLRLATEADCDLTHGGCLKIGHCEKAFKQLCGGLKSLPSEFQSQYQVVSPSQVQQLLPDYPSFGGVYRESGQGLNPLKFSLALLTLLESRLISVFADSPAINIKKEGKRYQVTTPKALIKAENLVISSNAYSLPGLYKPVTEKQFPVLSSVMVSDPLPDNVARQWKPGLMAMDTRSLKYYFRLLPDNRILFGGRGAITGKHANTRNSQKLLKQAFDRYFPALTSLNIAYFWSGWVSVSADSVPHVAKVDGENIFYATGFCGSGLSFSCHAGKLLAQRLTGKPQANTAFNSEIPAFPFANFRRTGLYIYYKWHRHMEQLFG